MCYSGLGHTFTKKKKLFLAFQEKTRLITIYVSASKLYILMKGSIMQNSKIFPLSL